MLLSDSKNPFLMKWAPMSFGFLSCEMNHASQLT